MSLLLLAAGWVAIGAIAVAAMRRRGHDTFEWALLFLFLGPLAIPLAVSFDRHRPAPPSTPPHNGSLDVLVAHDGSPDASAALRAALDLFGRRVTSITLAAVVDLDATTSIRGRDAQASAQARLDAIAGDVAAKTRVPVDTVILFGEPADALGHHASRHGYELIVAGGGAASRSRVAGRRAARMIAGGCGVPVFVGPATAGAG